MKRKSRLSQALFTVIFLGAAFTMAKTGWAVESGGHGGADGAAACSKDARHDGHGWRRHSESLWKKTLTDEQKTEIGRLLLSFKKDLAVKRAELRLKKTELAALVARDNADMAAVSRKVDEVTELKKEIMLRRYENVTKIRGILTPEQRVSFDSSILAGGRHGHGHSW